MANAKQTTSHGLRLLQTVSVTVLIIIPAGCQQQMAVQPSYKPLDPSTFFPDGRSARPSVPGTVARGHLRTDIHLFTGLRQPTRDLVGPPAPPADKQPGAKAPTAAY